MPLTSSGRAGTQVQAASGSVTVLLTLCTCSQSNLSGCQPKLRSSSAHTRALRLLNGDSAQLRAQETRPWLLCQVPGRQMRVVWSRV